MIKEKFRSYFHNWRTNLPSLPPKMAKVSGGVLGGVEGEGGGGGGRVVRGGAVAATS